MNDNNMIEDRHGIDLLREPLLNRGTAFTEAERERLGLRGLLPPHVSDILLQEARVLKNFRKMPNALQKYIYLSTLEDRNETLFYHLLMHNLEEMMPIVYTPTVGEACQQFGHIFQRPRGLYISAEDRGEIATLVNNWYHDDVRVIVVTDGERILGLGDLGANGMGIPVGKIALYAALGGINPALTLPVSIDVGTNNEALRDDPLYIGRPHERIRGEQYDELIDEFVTAVRTRWPQVLIQFEDFSNHTAFRLLEKYRDKICTFNDDIQGTAAVTVAGLLSGMRVLQSNLAEQTILFLGAGEAGVGIGKLIVETMQAERLSEREAMRRCWYVDTKGLVVSSRTDLAAHKLPFAHDAAGCPDLLTAIDQVRPTVLIGVSGRHGMFTQEVVEKMAAINELPIIFALSNPTANAECTAWEAVNWSDGRVIFASGSPFDPVEYKGKTIVPGQGNNAYIFPGVGLGVVASGARHVTEKMFIVAAQTLAELTTEDDLAMGRMYPSWQMIRTISAAIATAVAEVAHAQGLATVPCPTNLRQHIEAMMYQPTYLDNRV